MKSLVIITDRGGCRRWSWGPSQGVWGTCPQKLKHF